MGKRGKGKQYHLLYNIKAVWKKVMWGRGGNFEEENLDLKKWGRGRISSCRELCTP